jgi:hypothetical protein
LIAASSSLAKVVVTISTVGMVVVTTVVVVVSSDVSAAADVPSAPAGAALLQAERAAISAIESAPDKILFAFFIKITIPNINKNN